jgi:hypothetical protein
MACHVEIKKDSEAIQKLADYHKKQEAIPWKRVYRVPEYVVFSHKVADADDSALRDQFQCQKRNDAHSGSLPLTVLAR